MTRCKECNSRDWELITAFSEVFHIRLFQCRKCKRVVEFDVESDCYYGNDFSDPNCDYSYNKTWVELTR